jgi:aspartate carbamoyltransferase catalytic subunit
VSMQHFTDINDCSKELLLELLEAAREIAGNPERMIDARKGRLLVNLFYEPSTRTRLSFEIAAKRLGMHVVNFSALGSSVEKGESLEDTFHTIQAMSPDCVVVRHPEPGTADLLAGISEPGVHVINAGDGIAAHPSQALTDALTLRQVFDDLADVCLVIAGDVRHSRVARSNIQLLTLLGIGEIRLCGPESFLPPLASLASEDSPVSAYESLESAVRGANAIMMLRIQKERISSSAIPDVGDYHRRWGLKSEHLELAAPGCRVMHPGPMNPGVEISPDVASGPQSLIRRQVSNGVFARMALLDQLLD